jgi:hypothetical protein
MMTTFRPSGEFTGSYFNLCASLGESWRIAYPFLANGRRVLLLPWRKWCAPRGRDARLIRHETFAPAAFKDRR